MSFCWVIFYFPAKTTCICVTLHCKTISVTLQINDSYDAKQVRMCWWATCTFLRMFTCADEASLVVGAPSMLAFTPGHKRALVWTGEAATNGPKTWRVCVYWRIHKLIYEATYGKASSLWLWLQLHIFSKCKLCINFAGVKRGKKLKRFTSDILITKLSAFFIQTCKSVN